jgi:predicted RNase H-like HicB family nuclease
MKTLQYLVRINRDPGSDWGASVPDLPACVATGKTIDSALRRIERAIVLHVRGLRDDERKPRQLDSYATVEIAA